MDTNNVIKKYEGMIEALTQRQPVDKLVSLNDEAYFMFSFKSIEEFNFEYISRAALLAFGEFVQHKKMPMISKDERIKIYDTEIYEREMILSGLIFATHIQMTKYGEPITSRRFLTSNDSCLSFAQVSIDTDYYRWMIVSRSTEVNRMLPADLYTIGIIIKEWTEWFRRYAYAVNKGINITLVMNNPHYYME